jgi:hypothetical protein
VPVWILVISLPVIEIEFVYQLDGVELGVAPSVIE